MKKIITKRNSKYFFFIFGIWKWPKIGQQMYLRILTDLSSY